ncbi:hypothetical protein NE236_24830 [Actinoallomurus purpureus]|uniref:hypothetical protein n=1 Tax=Actinoallomurus purpureus TaxID=478114 RepID=UPI002093D65B|nr:hypothetical protein [Actinoallomurus purpureus]MCO6008208.1 hypothetical protein [Actinoallomurus purpureus]
MIMNKLVVSTAALGAVVAMALPAQAAVQPKWQRVGTDITGGVSGMALVAGAPIGHGRADVLIVRDNKKDGENRISTVRLRPGKAPAVTPLTWKGPLPKDVEALDAVPGRKNHYIALASEGTAYHVTVAGGTATVQGAPVSLPDRKDGDNYESFALFRGSAGKLFAVWATRGKNAEKAVVRTAPATVGKASLRIGTTADQEKFAVPFPNQDEVRHVSDLKVLPNGTVLVSSASDPNDDNGPFSSAVYNAGKLKIKGGHPVLDLKKTGSLRALRRFTKKDDHKVEGIVALANGQAIWGTDDENLGGFVAFDQVPR